MSRRASPEAFAIRCPELAYFDGRCEALLGPGVHVRTRRPWQYGHRCGRSAGHEVDGHAVCAAHALRPHTVLAYDPTAAEFRFGQLQPRKKGHVAWDF